LDFFSLRAHRIDRIVQRFALRYYQDNLELGLFAGPDQVHLLAFSAIMLNTDLASLIRPSITFSLSLSLSLCVCVCTFFSLNGGGQHNPAIGKKSKMTREQFVASHRATSRAALPVEFLEELYARIAEEEIRQDGQERHPLAVKQAWLQLLPGRKRRFAVLTRHALYWYRRAQDPEPRGSVSLFLPGLAVSRDPHRRFGVRLELLPAADTPERPGPCLSLPAANLLPLELLLQSELEANWWLRALQACISAAAELLAHHTPSPSPLRASASGPALSHLAPALSDPLVPDR
jgi:hypothetical protein